MFGNRAIDNPAAMAKAMPMNELNLEQLNAMARSFDFYGHDYLVLADDGLILPDYQERLPGNQTAAEDEPGEILDLFGQRMHFEGVFNGYTELDRFVFNERVINGLHLVFKRITFLPEVESLAENSLLFVDPYGIESMVA